MMIPSPAPAAWDATQQAALGLEVGRHGVIIGAPGSGKTEVLLQLYADRVSRDGFASDEIAVLSPTRLSAARLRDTLDRRLDQPSTGARARTSTSLAVQMVTTARALAGEKPPRLLTGASQDQLIARLIAGPDASGIIWPEELASDVRSLQGFRNQLRELIRVCIDYGVEPAELAELGRMHGHPEWVACSHFLPVYWDAIAREHPGEYDLSQFHRSAVQILDAVTEGRESSSILGDIARLRTIFLDDAHELTRSTIELVSAFARRGVSIVAAGDPDITTAAFQGAEPEFLARMQNFVGGGEGQELRSFVLGSVYRHGPRVRELVQRVSGAIGAAGWGVHRAAVSTQAVLAQVVSTQVVSTQGDAAGPTDTAAQPDPSDDVIFSTVASGAEQAAVIARFLRERHLGGAQPLSWSRMAVICRNRGQADSLSEALIALDVPTEVAAGGTVLRDHIIVRDLIWVASIALGMAEIDAESLNRMLRGPLGGLDHVGLRRLRSALLHEARQERDADQAPKPDDPEHNPELTPDEPAARPPLRSPDALLLEAFNEPAGLLSIDTESARRAEKLQRLLASASRVAESGGSIEDILWAAWDGSGLSQVWERQALSSSGVVADEANRSLDAVVALFFSAQRYEERSPGSDPRTFVDLLLSSDLPEDTLAPQARAETVTVTTPGGVIGRDFDVVIVPGVQEGVWPNLRLRGSLLASTLLAELCERGRATADYAAHPEGTQWAPKEPVADTDSSDTNNRRTVLHDELRMFAQAISRTTSVIMVVAVADEDSIPSRFFDLAPEGSARSLPSGTLSLRGLVGELRSDLEAQLSQDKQQASQTLQTSQTAAALAVLAEHRVAGADPAEWYGIRPVSTTEPLVDYEQDGVVPVSPSRMESFETCELDWVIGFLGGGDTNNAAGLGTLVHRALEHEQTPNVPALMAQVDAEWSTLSFDAEWEDRRMHERARQMVIRLVEYLVTFEKAQGRLLTAEQSFKVLFDRVRLNGAIDRVELYPGEAGEDASADRVVIVDLKTGNPDVTANTVVDNAQLSSYQLALESGALAGIPEGARPGGAKLIVVSPDGPRFKSIAQEPFTAEQLDEFKRRLGEAAIGMAGASFHANIASHCSNPHSFGLCTIHTKRPVSFR